MNNAVAHNLSYQTKLPVFDGGSNQDNSELIYSTQLDKDAVWKPKNRVYRPGVVGLHEEIIDFVNFIGPTSEEHWVREIVVAKVKNIVYSLWPECRTDVFGSFSTGLYLPTSDIDVVIFGKWLNLPLSTLENALRSSRIASDIKVLSRATVPIVKLTDADTGLHLDISFNMINSVRAVDMIGGFIQKFPCLRYLVFVLKQFLFQRDLNEVWTGGISSYALILMCISFLQHNGKEDEKPENVNLGTLLMEFFELYGRNFNYATTAIRVTGSGSYVRKEAVLKNMEPGSGPSFLCIEDPLCPGNNVGRRSYGAPQVRQAFEYAYLALSSALRSDAENEGSILSKILQISSATVESRRRVRAHALFMYQIIPSFITPVVPQPHPKSNSLPLHTQLSESNPSYSSQSNSANPVISPGGGSGDQRQGVSPSLSKEPIIVSARGFATRPPAFLRTPIGGEMLALSPHPPHFLYRPPQPVFYDPLILHLPNTQGGVPTTSGTPTSKPVFIILSHSSVVPFPDQMLAQPNYVPTQLLATSSPIDDESVAMSPALPDSDSDCDELPTDSDINEEASNGENHDAATSEGRQKTRDLQQQAADRNFKNIRSASASNPCSNLASQLAPLRLASSEQNICSPCHNKLAESSCRSPPPPQPLAPSPLPQPTAVSAGKVVEIPNCEHMEADSCSPPPPTHLRGGKSVRRRRRPLRRGGGGGGSVVNGSSTFTTAAPEVQSHSTAVANVCLSSNEESEGSGVNQGGHRLKRRCSQLHQAGHCCSDQSEKVVAASKSTSDRPKTWSSAKSSVRTSSCSPAQIGDKCGKYNSPTALQSGKNQQQSGAKNATMPISLKRLATSRPR
ncbi:unnamed protein product [Mesocestoides corti]|uniref:polynucleotide adenylyltransferase n=2 Tax=Mesocestoides corti TaxID=53468 RepID=A0A0R3UEI2_MESCO|nr:unnamed protein product [Mesocestoides corti]